MEILIKAAAVTLISTTVSLLVKSKNPEFSFILAVSCSAAVCIVGVKILSEMKGFVSEIIEKSNISSSVCLPVIKCVGIALITKLIAELCLDAGQHGTKTAVEYLGTSLALYTALPLLRSMMIMLEGLL